MSNPNSPIRISLSTSEPTVIRLGKGLKAVRVSGVLDGATVTVSTSLEEDGSDDDELIDDEDSEGGQWTIAEGSQSARKVNGGVQIVFTVADAGDDTVLEAVIANLE